MNLLGIHDIEAAAFTPPNTWIVDTIALSENPPGRDYSMLAPGRVVIARLNWGYGTTGTLPPQARMGEYLEALSRYVRASSGCSRWVIGNETNLSREWPEVGGVRQPIFPPYYADVYRASYSLIHQMSGHEQDEVLVAGSGPWNDELKYSGNTRGDWVTYTLDCLTYIGGGVDGIALHAYSHGYNPALASDTSRMNSPFQDRYYNFRCYQDYLRLLPDSFNEKAIYLKESNGDGPWQATGLIPAMLAEVNSWNQIYKMKIRSVVMFRYPDFDDNFNMEGKPDVLAEYLRAVNDDYRSPDVARPLPPLPIPTPPPIEPSPLPPLPAPQRTIDPKLIARGVNFNFIKPSAGTWYYRITDARWIENASGEVGPDHHILGRVLRDGAEYPGEKLVVNWPSGSTIVISKRDDPHASYNYDYPMNRSLNEYSIRMNDVPSDSASGIGMGKGGNPREHTSTWITWEFVQATDVQPEPPTPTPPLQRKLIWPCSGPFTQRFGEGGARFGQRAHNGIDIAVPIGTPILSITDGEVMFVGIDELYGNYIRVWHESISSHSFYAHLSEIDVQIGQMVKQGDRLGESGNSGNSTGPHLHFELRGGSRDGYADVTSGYSAGRYNPQDAYLVTGSRLTPG